MEPLRQSGPFASLSTLKLQNPFVLRVGQVMTGFGLGCGLGIGVGVPIPMDIPGVAQVTSAAHGMTRHIGGGRRIQGLIKRVGIKNLEAGIGCGVGLGHGFGIGLALKPGVSQQILRMLQEGCTTMLNKVRPQHHGETPTSEARGVLESGAFALKPSQSLSTTSSSNQLASTPSTKNSETEVEKLRTQNEILRTLLRHQEKIEDLERENALLREELNINGINRSLGRRGLHSNNTCTKCFDCRRLSRRRNKTISA